MLAQHSKTDMGRKTIDYVSLYGPGSTTPCFMFPVVDYKEPGQNAVAVGKDSSMSTGNSLYSIIQDGLAISNG